MSDRQARSRLLGGLPVQVVSDEDAEQADFVVCATVSYFPDDVHTVCSVCEAKVVHRPYAPKRPPRVCLECAMALASPKH